MQEKWIVFKKINKKMQKYLRMSKKSSTFAPAFDERRHFLAG